MKNKWEIKRDEWRSAHLQWMKPQLLSSIQLLNIIYGIWLPFFCTNINNWLKQESETIKCACEPGCRPKFSSILRSWDSSAFKEISKKSPKITIPNLRFFFFAFVSNTITKSLNLQSLVLRSIWLWNWLVLSSFWPTGYITFSSLHRQ